MTARSFDVPAPPTDAADRLLTEEAAPVVRRVVASRLGRGCADAEDVSSQVLIDLMTHLRKRSSEFSDSQRALSRYAAAAAHHGCDHYLRRKYPLRWQLRNRIRYALEHDARLDIWKGDDGAWWCGRAGEREASPGVPPLLARPGSGSGAGRIRAFLAEIFAHSQGPLPLAAVADMAAATFRVPLLAQEDVGPLENLADPARSADVAIDVRRRVERTWTEIQELPVRQRQALLLNLKDEAVALFVLTGTASLRAIAAALDLRVEALADIWSRLPLNDNDIAARLRCTRQQVINLRASARKRLAARVGPAT
jgi:RNA polymerase sigma factor (sigma-70 family)